VKHPKRREKEKWKYSKYSGVRIQNSGVRSKKAGWGLIPHGGARETREKARKGKMEIFKIFRSQDTGERLVGVNSGRKARETPEKSEKGKMGSRSFCNS
jgi:hypothetical protein